MKSGNALVSRIVGAVVAVLLAIPAAAQNGTIAGTVRDTTGAVLPGVTVEASSPALIEKTRTAVTDETGQYRIVDLRLGEYALSFTLSGFSTFRRDGIRLPAGVTLTVDAEMRLGAVEETITVSGQSPLVDVQNTNQSRSITQAIMEELPTGRQFGHYAITIPGVVTNRQDVGGTGIAVTVTNLLSVHGSNSNDMPLIIDGMRYGNLTGSGAGNAGTYLVNTGMVEEIAVNTSGATAETDAGGVSPNVILRQGGNTFRTSLFGSYSNEGMQWSNFDESLRARGATTPASIKQVWDVGVGVGGPFVQDKLWFYGAYRHYGVHDQPPGAFRARNPAAVIFEPGEPAVSELWNQGESFRLTWQTSKSTKASFLFDAAQRCLCDRNLSSTRSWEASGPYTDTDSGLPRIIQGTWNWTISNQLLFEVGETYRPDAWVLGIQEEVPLTRSGVVDAGTGISSRAPTAITNQESRQMNGKVALTYVTGSHSLKVGSTWFHGWRQNVFSTPNDSWLNLRNGVPISVTQRTTPITTREHLNMNLGIFAQEQYTFRRLTANLGVRFDWVNSEVPSQSSGAVRYAGARQTDAVTNVPNWKDISPRYGLSYNLFGDGRTALKWNLGKYLAGEATGLAAAVNPMSAGVSTATRPWTDTNGNLQPDCDLTIFTANGECGVINNLNFGQPGRPTVRYDPNWVTGWGNRDYNWELMAGVQHELLPGMLSVDVSYHRRSFGNFNVTVNELVTPADFDYYCITAPTDSRLPGGGGGQICGLYNVKPPKFGQSDTLRTKADRFGDMEQVFDGVDVFFTARLPRGVVVQGGSATGRTRVNVCDVIVGNPQITEVSAPASVASHATDFCNSEPPMLTQVKLSGVVPLPWQLQGSAVFQSLRYPQDGGIFGGFTRSGILATYAAPVAAITPSLGRPLSGGATTATVELVPPGVLYGDRLHQLDLRIARNFQTADGKRIQPSVDLFNLFNANTVLTFNNTFGPRWQQPLTVMQGRMARFSLQVNF